jgi:antitoxin (DNA-binding transcriptional repressor) of toxin-antitoxin stability system
MSLPEHHRMATIDRDHLSRYLDRVGDGDEVIVTDRGRAIARVARLITVGRR